MLKTKKRLFIEFFFRISRHLAWPDPKSFLVAAKELFRAIGGELKEFYLVMGQYDMVVISKAPDDETAAKAALMLGSAGSVRTETFRAFTEDEYRKIFESLPWKMFAEAFRKPVYAPLKCISLKASRLEVTILLWMIYISDV